MADYSAEKKEWIGTIAGEARDAYGILMRSGVLVVSSQGFPDVEVVFPKAKFAHLCGFDYYRDPRKTRLAPAESFYDDIASDRFDSSLADYTHRHSRHNVTFRKRRDNTARKVAIAADVFANLNAASHVVRSAKGTIAIFMGGSLWSLGLNRQTMRNGEYTGRYIPASLVDDDILSDRIHRRGTAVHPITSMSWR